MTNSMNKDLLALRADLEATYNLIGVDEVLANQMAFDVRNEDTLSLLSDLKTRGFRQLSMLTCVDFIKEGQFQLVYLLFDWDRGLRLQIRTRISRENPFFKTATLVYPGAQYYERDVHEFFGVVFEGNEDALKQLFLENWDDLPPLRKDFNARAYSDRKYEKRQYTKDFSEKAGEEA